MMVKKQESNNSSLADEQFFYLQVSSAVRITTYKAKKIIEI